MTPQEFLSTMVAEGIRLSDLQKKWNSKFGKKERLEDYLGKTENEGGLVWMTYKTKETADAFVMPGKVRIIWKYQNRSQILKIIKDRVMMSVSDLIHALGLSDIDEIELMYAALKEMKEIKTYLVYDGLKPSLFVSLKHIEIHSAT